MKILHTADWHIGKKLHKHELSQDFSLFIDWLCELVPEKEIDCLLVSGDIFDLANPSSEARTAYYQALVRLSRLHCKIVLTGGNHDSPAVLNAPKELLRNLDIHVIGNLPPKAEDYLIPLKRDGKVKAVIAALPYLRNPDLRQADEQVDYASRVEAVRAGIAKVFKEAAAASQEQYPKVPALAMGHLYAAGASTSESERDIQIGNEASFEAQQFGDYFSYIALGHIHKPQNVNALVPVYYSGSPLPLSFSERSDQKRVLILETNSGFEPESIPVPEFRKLKKLKGDLKHLKKELQNLSAGEPLETLVELELVEENYDPSLLTELDRFVSDFNEKGVRVVKHRATFKKRTEGASELFKRGQQLEDLKPLEVFEKRLEKEDYSSETQQMLRDAFHQILEESQTTA
jgi:exonuclease SbcD